MGAITQQYAYSRRLRSDRPVPGAGGDRAWVFLFDVKVDGRETLEPALSTNVAQSMRDQHVSPCSISVTPDFTMDMKISARE